jgi:membrane protease YdiL (CAAX protease family)
MSKLGRNQIVFLLSPLALIALLLITAWMLAPILDVWVWVPLCFIYWIAIGLVSFLGMGKDGIRKMLKPSKRGLLWPMIAVLIPLLLLPLQFLPNLKLLSPLWVLLLTIVVALINPWFEEIYWRGLLLEMSANKLAWIGILYSSILFSSSHLILGIKSIACRYPGLYISLFVLGVIWCVIYKKTNSLRWPLFSHFLIDIFTLSVPVFLNLYIPPGMK